MSYYSSATTPATSLIAYAGPWTAAEAGHLLRRATYAPLAAEIEQARTLGLDGTLNLLFAAPAPPDPPVYYDYDGHPDAGIGDDWTTLRAHPIDRQTDRNARMRSLLSWLHLNAGNGGMSVTEKMVFFWHNHFGIDSPGIPRVMYQFFDLYRTYATGDFRQLVKKMTINPAMLAFLNGNQSTVVNPNENFAREILELFTIGKGPLAGPGDYTTYTEQDVTELAKAFTGWRTRNFNSEVAGEQPESYFQANRHDTTTKTLSARFGNAQIPNGDENEYADVVDLIFQQDEVSRYICRKLYRHFVHPTLDANVEQNVIEPMASVLRASDYVIEPALRALFGSEHFFTAKYRGAQIKTPIELVQSIFRPLDYVDQQASLTDRYEAARRAHFQASSMGLDVRRPPSVAGWTAYYQEPALHRLWLNTATIQARKNFARIVLRNNGFNWNGSRHPFDWIAYVESFGDDGFNVYAMIERMAADLLPRPLHPDQLQALRDLLLPDIDDFVWAAEWADLSANPGDDNLRDSIRNRLRQMVTGMTDMAEFQLL